MKAFPGITPHTWPLLIRTCCPDSQVQQPESLRGKQSRCSHCSSMTGCSVGWLIIRLVSWLVLFFLMQYPAHKSTFNTWISFEYELKHANVCLHTHRMLKHVSTHVCMCKSIYVRFGMYELLTYRHGHRHTERCTQKQQEDQARGSLIAHQAASESWREASIRLKPTLRGPPVDYSGKDKLPGASIHSQQPPLDLQTPEEFWYQEGIRDLPLHTGRYAVVCLCCINHWDKQLYREIEQGYKSITRVVVIQFVRVEWDRLISSCPQKHVKWDFHKAI